MIYLSDLVGKPVYDADGVAVGRLADVVVMPDPARPHPAVTALVVAQAQGNVLIPPGEAVVLVGPAVVLAHTLQKIAAVEAPNGLWLARDVLDKEIIDTAGARVVRVNDLELVRVEGGLYLANVDVGGAAVLRRLGLFRIAQRIASRLGLKLTQATVSWAHVDLLPGSQPVRMRLSGGKLADLHPADLAEIISDLSRPESSQVVASLDVEQLADTLEEVEPDFQASLVETMPDEKVADVLEEMEPDEAADLLAELPEERSEELLKLMEDDEAKDVRKLLAYPEDSAGGIMTTAFEAVRPNLTAEQVIAHLRETAHEAETIYYVYVTDDDGRLLGVVSLQALVLAKPDTPVTELMHERVVRVRLEDSQDEVAQVVAKYNLLAVPVVDDQDRLQGIVTADDAVDKIIPTAWKKRLPRLYR